jgi:putative transposase
MPRKYTIKEYLPQSIYHIFNRGVNKQVIIHDDQDCSVFLNILKECLSPPPNIPPHTTIIYNSQQFDAINYKRKNYYQRITLLSYCLMPNHFHLLLKQEQDKTISSFMKAIGVRYALYYNQRYHRVGQLYESRYKGVRLIGMDTVLFISRYIHRNPNPLFSQPSSYPTYLGMNSVPWINTKIISSHLAKKYSHLTYQQYVEGEIGAIPQNNPFNPEEDYLLD